MAFSQAILYCPHTKLCCKSFSRCIPHVVRCASRAKASSSTVASDEKNTIQSLRSASLKLVGAHVSAKGGVSEAVRNAVQIGARAFALFVRTHRRWNSKVSIIQSLDLAEINRFRDLCVQHGFTSNHILPHGSFLINLASCNESVLEKSRNAIVEEMRICESLGLSMYNFHPGSNPRKNNQTAALNLIADSINMALERTSNIVAVIESTAGSGNTLGYSLEQLASLIESVYDQSRIGVCLDTCHLFAAGYDLRTPNKVKSFLKDFDRIVGFRYLRGMHLNDSNTVLNSRKDRHANIGKGYIGLECFKALMRDDRLNGIPLIVETPFSKAEETQGDSREIDLLYALESGGNKIISELSV